MISDHDRSYYIGASDTARVVGPWGSKTFETWYLTKLGLTSMDYCNDSMMAGTAYEHRILEKLGIPELEMDKQIISGRLRVNLDGNTHDTIYEVKTYKVGKVFKPSKAYRNQVQVQMHATEFRKAFIVAYGLEAEDYRNFYREIDMSRLSLYEVLYDEEFINDVFLPRLRYLSDCLDRGVFPKESDIWKDWDNLRM